MRSEDRLTKDKILKVLSEFDVVNGKICINEKEYEDGLCAHKSREIIISENLKEKQRKETLIHEMIHAYDSIQNPEGYERIMHRRWYEDWTRQRTEETLNVMSL